MGYRSDVKLVIKKEQFKDLKQYPWFIDDLLDYAEVFEEDDIVKLAWFDIKWYESYPEIENIMKYLHELERTEIPFSYIRIGEEDDDVEKLSVYGDGSCDRIYLYRSIDFD